MNDKIIGSIILEGETTVEDVVVTDKSNCKRVIAEGTLQDLDVENRNHRIYEKKDIKPEIEGARIKELIEAKQFKGEMSHPLSDSMVRQQTIDGKLTCVRYLKVWLEGNRVKAQFKGTNNDLGQYFDDDLREGCKPAFSLRALGSIDNINGKAYVRGVRVITYDHVIFPSHRVAYTERVLTESAMSCNADADPHTINLAEQAKIITEMNQFGKIINLTAGDAQYVLNKLQRESAGIDAVLNTFEGIADNVMVTSENKLRLSTKFGETIYLNLDEHVQNLIMDYVYKM